jgi:hypothetical protein
MYRFLYRLPSLNAAAVNQVDYYFGGFVVTGGW